MPANWRNRTLWTGDNLDIMRGMNGESVDLIYLDPPFNSNRDYAAPIGSEAAGAAFKDTWTLSDVDEAWHGEVADRQPALYSIIDAAGMAHGLGMKSYLIMMAVRLLEMQRLLKPTGSIYLHCDPTASHYLKMLLDSIFGQAPFRNELSWRRSNPKSLGSTNFPNCRDIILRYTASDRCTFNKVYGTHDPEYVRRAYKHQDPDGRRYRLLPLLNPNQDRPNLTYEFLGVHRVWRWTRERMEQAYSDGLVVQLKPGAVPQYKKYLEDSKGRTITNDWGDIEQAAGSEAIGYPTQKPVALLDRIIRASSNEGDKILDPFCGCATALVAADRLNREWAGIDLSPLAARLVLKRLREDRGPLFDDVTHREDLPRRTDLGEVPNYRTHKHTLYGRQEGICGGCQVLFPFRNMTVDHVVARSHGGSDHIENLQLLCGACNSMKGAEPQEYLIARLKAEGIRT